MPYGDLATLADVRAWLQTQQATLPSTDDAIISRLITGASQFIETVISASILSTDYEEIRDAIGGQQFVFANKPVTAVASVVIGGFNIPAIPPTSQQSGVVTVGFFGGPAGYLFTETRLVIRGYWVPRLPLGVVLQYTAGYLTVPADLRQACIELVATRYRTERDHPGIVSTVMQPSTTVAYSQKDMNSFVATTLARYTTVTPVSSFSRVLAPTDTDPATIIGAL